jgi:hypothetical protein
MSIIYELADPSIHDLAREIMEAHHGNQESVDPTTGEVQLRNLRMADGTYPRLCILMATDDDPEGDGNPVKLHDRTCAAVISIIPYKQRVDKRADAEIIIDAERWKKFSQRTRRALLDHEITHLEFKIDDDGFVQTDDAGRPKLRLRDHDWDVTGFRSIAQRYGDDSIDVMNLRQLQKDYGDVMAIGVGLFK